MLWKVLPPHLQSHSLPRSRFFGCHTTLPLKSLGELRDIQKTAASETTKVREKRPGDEVGYFFCDFVFYQFPISVDVNRRIESINIDYID